MRSEEVTPRGGRPWGGCGTRLWGNIKGGKLGRAPVILGLTIIVIVFGFTAQNFFTAVNFNNIITQMAGTTMLAFGVVFVLLLGEIDLSIAYLSGVAGVMAAELQKPYSGNHFTGIWPLVGALVVATLMGAFAVVGILLASVGLYGVLSYLAGRRTHEIGVRVALGASSGDVVRVVGYEGLGVVTIGIPAGLAMTMASCRPTTASV